MNGCSFACNPVYMESVQLAGSPSLAVPVFSGFVCAVTGAPKPACISACKIKAQCTQRAPICPGSTTKRSTLPSFFLFFPLKENRRDDGIVVLAGKAEATINGQANTCKPLHGKTLISLPAWKENNVCRMHRTVQPDEYTSLPRPLLRRGHHPLFQFPLCTRTLCNHEYVTSRNGQFRSKHLAEKTTKLGFAIKVQTLKEWSPSLKSPRPLHADKCLTA